MAEEPVLVFEERKIVNDAADVPVSHVGITVASITPGAERVGVHSKPRSIFNAVRVGVGVRQLQPVGEPSLKA
jgi:hypothetical protein